MDYLYLSLGRKTLKRKITAPFQKHLKVMFQSCQHTFSWWPISIYCPSFHEHCTSFNPYKWPLGNNSLGTQYINCLLILLDSLYVFAIKLQTLFWLQGGWLLSCLFYFYLRQTLGIDSELKMKDGWRLISSIPISYASIPAIPIPINTRHLATS